MTRFEIEFNTLNGLGDLGNTCWTEDFYLAMRGSRLFVPEVNKILVTISEDGLFCIYINGISYLTVYYVQGMVFDLNKKYAGLHKENIVTFTMDYLSEREAGENFRNVELWKLKPTKKNG